ncbi:MAG: hypothetical protein WCK27_17670, partial [Verrucomicrobiota bacterium]
MKHFLSSIVDSVTSLLAPRAFLRAVSPTFLSAVTAQVWGRPPVCRWSLDVFSWTRGPGWRRTWGQWNRSAS